MPPAINPTPIRIAEYDAIVARIRKLGRSDASIEIIAAEFNRGKDTIRRIGQRSAA